MSAYVPGFDNDLFVSYTHTEDPVWIQTFVKSLSDQLLSQCGIKVSIWQDTNRLRVGESWQVEIEEGIQGSAILLAVLSPGYRKSDWCLKECQIFQKRFDSREKFEKSSRFFKVVKMPWENDEHLGFWKTIEHLELFARNEGVEGVEPFSFGSNDFQTAIRKLANSVERTLRRLRRERERVFVASPAEECLSVWKELREDLHVHGYDVQPEGLLNEGFEDGVILRPLKDARLSVHLLGTVYDPFVERQIQLAADLERKLIFWLVSSPDAVDDHQKGLIAALRNGHRPDRRDIELPSGWAFLPGLTPRRLIEHVLTELKSAAPPVPQPPPSNGAPRVYIVHDATTAEDARIAAMLREEIRARERMEVFLSRADLPSPADLQIRHRTLLQTCDGVLLCRKAAPEKWQEQAAPEVLFAEQWLPRRKPLKSRAFLVPDPGTWAAARKKWPDLQVIPWSSPPRTGDLEPFLAPLRNGGAHGR